ncbi:oxygen-independent coproporphyrinogen III oxidase [Octadecabacter sp. G9-8]|uniref:Coproporphyrinogen-III oxidase n=1 Tax=Octadecabacter dasysiphoniae TaxID=2909341 RepID=A0ABS9CSY8_9RHOB|nr:oxygen-independent coproporphyrinogen III oxidase [Octadecabacter dasysiphoniae]MCF2870350.1 oxygen-independent coproporphyrinogen III oxidase [Octadecabacter dasysiphoniae]
MKKIDSLRELGLFDAKVPRYTSYPPANHFENGVGQQFQKDWLRAVPDGSDISVYIHIPFCKRLCWFCACRTQGTKTMRPVDAYVEYLRREIKTVRATLPRGIRMARLHLGGGTPTILSPATMARLLDDVFDAFATAPAFEFSVEIDPTEASDALLQTLVGYGLNRASLGVQDFAPKVQKAIGRPQSLDQTRSVITFLRDNGVTALNLDLLYGLPHQTPESFRQTLDHVIAMAPDRLAIYGYAHVPWMSKRQIMIKDEDLPSNEARFELATMAQVVMNAHGYRTIGIDHFAKPSDALFIAQQNDEVRRNFQGYTDDQSDTLIGIGASAISRFPDGYVQNAVATSAYQDRIDNTQLAGHKGYAMRGDDTIMSQIIEDLLCRFKLNTAKLHAQFPAQSAAVNACSLMLVRQYPDLFSVGKDDLQMRDWAKPLVRIIASSVDTFSRTNTGHSAAI